MENELASRVDQSALRWVGHVERIDEYHMARRVMMAEVSGGQVKGRPWYVCMVGWLVGVKVALGSSGSQRLCEGLDEVVHM